LGYGVELKNISKEYKAERKRKIKKKTHLLKRAYLCTEPKLVKLYTWAR
jgi:hypothetical protein